MKFRINLCRNASNGYTSLLSIYVMNAVYCRQTNKAFELVSINFCHNFFEPTPNVTANILPLRKHANNRKERQVVLMRPRIPINCTYVILSMVCVGAVTHSTSRQIDWFPPQMPSFTVYICASSGAIHFLTYFDAHIH